MTKQIREYLEHLRLFLDGEHSREEYMQEMKRLHVRIGFFSHERLVHMFIMLALEFTSLRCCSLCFLFRISSITISLKTRCRRCT